MVNRTVILPDAGDDLRDSDDAGTAYAECVAVETGEYVRVFVSGMTSETAADDIGEQTRDVLRRIERALADVGGEMSDLVRVRVYVESPNLTQENFEKIHAARNEVFEAETYPTSTLVEVAGLIREGRTIEIDADAVVPNGD